MSINHNDSLQRVITAIQRRWGPDALRPLGSQSKHRPTFSTGFPSLDELLGNGLPPGTLIQLVGEPTVGLTTLALRALAAAQREDSLALYVDADHTLDPAYAARCGIDVEQVLVVWPVGSTLGLDIVRDVIVIGGRGIIVLDLGLPRSRPAHDPQQVLRALRHIAAALPRTGWSVLSLTPSPTDRLAQLLARHAGLCLKIEREAWQHSGRDITGCVACVRVLKHPSIPLGRATVLIISFEPTKAG